MNLIKIGYGHFINIDNIRWIIFYDYSVHVSFCCDAIAHYNKPEYVEALREYFKDHLDA